MKQKPIVQLVPVIVLLVLCIAIFSLITSLSGTIRRGSLLKARQDTLLKLQSENREVQKKLQDVESPEFIEKEARDKLNLAKPGETVILIDRSAGNEDNQQQAQPQVQNWKKWWNLFF